MAWYYPKMDTPHAGLPVSVCTGGRGVRSQSNLTFIPFLPLSCYHQMMEGYWGDSDHSYFVLTISSVLILEVGRKL